MSVGLVNAGLAWVRTRFARIKFNRTLGHHQGVLLNTEEGVECQRYRFRDGAVVLETEWRLVWSEVSGIFGYKIDAWTVDQIRLAFEVQGDGGITYVVTEDMEGYQSLVEALNRHFTGMNESWWRAVAFPAFETKRTTIWKRGGMGLDSGGTLPDKSLLPTSGAEREMSPSPGS